MEEPVGAGADGAQAVIKGNTEIKTSPITTRTINPRFFI
jgi:hypothetical protein